jgi:hypothetical protein
MSGELGGDGRGLLQVTVSTLTWSDREIPQATSVKLRRFPAVIRSSHAPNESLEQCS